MGCRQLREQLTEFERVKRDLSSGNLRLGTRAPRVAQANNLVLRIHRKLTDTLPGQLDTRLTLDVAGEAREEYIGPLLPAGFAPTRLQTPLPARLEADGRLRVQVRPGRWSLELGARADGALDSIDVRRNVTSCPWARQSGKHRNMGPKRTGARGVSRPAATD